MITLIIEYNLSSWIFSSSLIYWSTAYGTSSRECFELSVIACVISICTWFTDWWNVVFLVNIIFFFDLLINWIHLTFLGVFGIVGDLLCHFHLLLVYWCGILLVLVNIIIFFDLLINWIRLNFLVVFGIVGDLLYQIFFFMVKLTIECLFVLVNIIFFFDLLINCGSSSWFVCDCRIILVSFNFPHSNTDHLILFILVNIFIFFDLLITWIRIIFLKVFGIVV